MRGLLASRRKEQRGAGWGKSSREKDAESARVARPNHPVWEKREK